jgi:hypothetical protein
LRMSDNPVGSGSSLSDSAASDNSSSKNSIRCYKTSTKKFVSIYSVLNDDWGFKEV